MLGILSVFVQKSLNRPHLVAKYGLTNSDSLVLRLDPFMPLAGSRTRAISRLQPVFLLNAEKREGGGQSLSVKLTLKISVRYLP